MSMIDFKQEARDQGCLHIVVKPIGEVSTALVGSILKVLRDMAPVQLPELKNSVLFLRFLDGRDLPSWASGTNKWDQFSAHKTVHGFLGVGQCLEAADWTSTILKYKEARKAHISHLCASKYLLYGPKEELEPCQSETTKDGVIVVPCSADIWDAGPQDVEVKALETAAVDLARTIFVSLKTRMESYLRVLDDPGRWDNIATMRLRAPLESKEQHMEELDQKQSTRNHLARIGKHVGDLCLLIGQLQNASHWYQRAVDQLKSQKEWLWAGSAYEGLSVTAMMTKEREEVLGQKAQGVGVPSGRSKFRVKHGTPRATVRGGTGAAAVSGSLPRPVHTLDPRRLGDFSFTRGSRFASLKRTAANSPSPSAELDHLDLQGGFVISNRSGSGLGDNENEDEEEEEEEEDVVDGGGVSMEAIIMEELKREEEEGVMSLIVDSRLLNKDFIETKFSLALVCYNKAGDVGSLPLLESTLKFARYLVKVKHFVKAAETLQKTARIDGISDPERLTLYQTMAAIFDSMGYHRKKAMFNLYAARLASSIANSNHHPLLREAHDLLLKSLPGYRLSASVDSLPSTAASHIGWPSLQAGVLKDFIYLSRRLGEDLTVIKHACYLLQVFCQHMDIPSLKGVTNTLDSVVKQAHNKCLTSPQYASAAMGKLISPIPLTQFPVIRSFHARPLITMLEPRHRHGSTKNTHLNNVKASAGEKSSRSNPFIYSPFAPGQKKGAKRKEILWVEGDAADIALSIANPLPYELRVENMTLLMEGAEVEIYPSSLTLPGGTEQSHFTLVSIPREPGIVNVLGYEATVFGVHYECYKKLVDDPIIRVVPKLPHVKIRSVLVPTSEEANEREGGGGGGGGEKKGILEKTRSMERKRSQSDVVSEGRNKKFSQAGLDTFELLDGESCEFDFDICGLNDISITSLTASVKPYNKDYCEFSWDADSLSSQLPLPPARNAKLRVSAHAYIPHCFRLINDFSTGVVSSAVAADSRRMMEVPGSAAGDLIVKESRRSMTPTFTSYNEKEREETDSGQDKDDHQSVLMDSLNLERPSFPPRTGSGSSARSVSLQRASPESSLKGARSITPSKRGRVAEGVRRDLGGWNYSDIEFGLDKRASIRSDPGERGEHGERGGKSRFAYLKSLGKGSAHTSPTSSISTLAAASEASHPISIPNASGADEHDSGLRGNLKPEAHSIRSSGLARNASFQSRTNKTSTASLTRGVHGNNDKGDKPAAKRSKEPVIRKVRVEGKFTFEYSGGVGEGYYREATSDVSVLVKPCLLFEQFDITICSKSQELFQVAFVVHNVSCFSLLVCCNVDQADLSSHGGTPEVKEVMHGNTSKKFVLLMRRFGLDGNKPVKDKIQLARQYSKCLAKILQFRWEVKSSVPIRSGHVSLEGLHLPVSMATIMQPLPITFSVYLNQVLCSPLVPLHSKTLSCGELARLSVKLQNNSSTIFPVSYLVLEPYWFSDELRKIIKDPTSKMLHSNTLVTRVPQLTPGAMFEHEVCLTFLYKGSFLMDTKCMFRPLVYSSHASEAPSTQEKNTTDPGNATASEYIDHPAAGLEGSHNVVKSPLKVAHKPKPPDFSLTSTSLPVSFSPPQPSPLRSTPPPLSSTSRSPPPVRPKSAKALARKFEVEFATRKASLATSPPNPVDLKHLVKMASPQLSTEESTSTQKEEADGDHTHSETPPPIPTSKRPSLQISRTAQLGLTANLSQSKTSILSSSLTAPVSPDNGSTETQQPITHKGQRSKLIGNSDYHNLLEERKKESGLVQVVIGPHFSFQVS